MDTVATLLGKPGDAATSRRTTAGLLGPKPPTITQEQLATLKTFNPATYPQPAGSTAVKQAPETVPDFTQEPYQETRERAKQRAVTMWTTGAADTAGINPKNVQKLSDQVRKNIPLLPDQSLGLVAATAAGKTAAGFMDWMTSPEGLAMTGLAAFPPSRVPTAVQFFQDMAKGGAQSASGAIDAWKKGDMQGAADNIVNTLANLGGAFGLGKGMVRTPEMQAAGVPPLLAERLVPAVQLLPTSEILTASPKEITHDEVLAKAGIAPEEIPHEDVRRGFVDPANHNQWYTREQAEAATGIEGTAAAGWLASQDLPRPLIASELPRPAAPQPAQAIPSAADKRAQIISDTEKKLDAAQLKNQATVEHNTDDPENEWWYVTSSAKGNDRAGMIYKNEDGTYGVRDENDGYVDHAKTLEEAIDSAKQHVQSGESQEHFNINADARSEIINALDLPADFSITDIQDTKWGSVYYHLQKKIGEDEDGEPEHENYKVSIRDHEPSPFREKEFGANDAYFEVPKGASLQQLAEAVAKVERFAQRRSEAEKANAAGKPALSSPGGAAGIKTPLVTSSQSAESGAGLGSTPSQEGQLNAARLTSSSTAGDVAKRTVPPSKPSPMVGVISNAEGNENVNAQNTILGKLDALKPETRKLADLKARAAAVKAGQLPNVNAPAVRTYEPTARRPEAGGRRPEPTVVIPPAGWQPPRAEPVAPLMAEGQGYGLREAIKDAGGLSAPDLNEALKQMRSGQTAGQVVAGWSGGRGEADALGNILEEIHEAQKSGDRAKYNTLRKAYASAFPKSSAGGSDTVLQGLQEMSDSGLFGDVPADTSELYQRVWKEEKAGPPVDREATAAAQAHADFEAFNKSLRLSNTPKGNKEVFSGEQKLGDVMTGKRGNTILVPTREGENLPPEYQQQVLARAGIESASLSEPDYIGMGAAVPGEFAPVESFVTSTKNAVTDAERAQRGLPPAMATAQRSFGRTWDEAMALLDRAPETVDELMEELRQFPRAVNDTENALLLHRQIDVRNQHAKAVQEQAAAADDARQFPNRAADAEEWKLRAAKLSDDLLELYDINKFVGTETARGLASRKMLAREDYSLAQMELAKRSANDGHALADDQKAEIQRLHDIIEQTQKEFDDYIQWSQQKLAEQQAAGAVDELKGRVADDTQGAESAKVKVGGLDLQGRVTAGLKTARKSGRSLPDLARYIQKLAEAFIRQGVTERDPLIDAVHGVLKEQINPNITRRETMDAISGYGDFKALNPDEVKAKLRDLRGQMQQVAKLEDLEAKRPMQKTGIERRQPTDEERRLIKQVNEAKRKFGVVTTDPAKQLKGALDAIKTRLTNQIADLDYQIATRTRIVKSKTRVDYDAEANVLKARRDELQQQFDDIFPKAPISDAQRLARAKASVQRSIDVYTARINAGDVLEKKQSAKAPSSFELEALKARRDGLRAEFEELQNTDAAVQARRNMAGLQRSVEELQRRLAANDILDQPAGEGRPSTVEESMVRAKRDQLREQLNKLKAAAPETIAAREQAAVDALNASIAELERRINEGDIEAKGLDALQVSSPRLTALRGERDDLQRVLRALQAAARPKRSPEEIALGALKSRLRNAAAQYEERLVAGDFGPRVRRTIKLDEEALQLKAANEKAKNEFQRGLILDRLAKRKWHEKMADTFVKWRRGFLLSGPVTLAKLTSAAIQRLAITPAEELLGGVYSLALPKLAARAPREGGWNTDAEAKAITEAVTRGMKDAGKMVTTGQGPLETVYGKGQEGGVRESDVEPRSVIDFFGRLHGALKAPVKRAEFARSFEKRIAWNLQQGVDASDPMVQTRVALEAFKDAQRSIFLQDNRLVSAYKRALTAFEQKNKATGKVPVSGKAAATVARTLLPIVRVPTNIVAETFQYAGGLISGNAKLALALRTGIENLAPEEADQILRHLKKGTLGAALMALGYFSPNAIGGYYQAGEKRSKNDVPAGNIKLYGHNVPSWLLHNPLLETLQIGATVRRVADSKLRKHDANSQGITAGLVAGALGLTEEVPFVREQMEVAQAFNQSERTAFFGELAKSIAIPQLAQWAATATDRTAAGPTVQRKPGTVLEHLEAGVPGLRQRVPETVSPDVTTIAGYYMRFGRDGSGRPLRNLTPAERDHVKAAVTNRLQARVDAGEDFSRAALVVKITDLQLSDAMAAWQAADEPTKQATAPVMVDKLRKTAAENHVDVDQAKRYAAQLRPYMQPAQSPPGVLSKY